MKYGVSYYPEHKEAQEQKEIPRNGFLIAVRRESAEADRGCKLKITRIIGSPEGVIRDPGYIIERSFQPDEIINQKKSEVIRLGNGSCIQQGWSLSPKDIYRYDMAGEASVITQKTVDGERTFVENAKEQLIGRAYEGSISFQISEEQRIMGLGQHEEGITNYRGCVQHLYQNNMQIPMPVIISSRNYGILLDAECLMVYEEKNNRITVTLDAVVQIDYYFIEGENLKEVIKGIRKLTGKAAMLPLWAYGYIQSRERYKTQEEMIRIAKEFEKRDIPISCLVLDWMSWEEGKWGNKRFCKSRFPDIKALTEYLHDKGIAFMVSVWPNINKGCEDNLEMLAAGKMYANLSTYDAFDEAGRALYWKQCEREIYAGGADAWWCDSTEPFTPDWNGSEKKSPEERYELAKESLTKYMDAREANAYALLHAKGIHDNQRKADPETRVVNLTRSGYPSIQKYGAVLWSGDIMATWDVFRKQIAEGLSMSSSGIPYWTLDIGAFFTGNLQAWRRQSDVREGTQPWFWNGDFEEGTADKGYCELYVRWLQYGTFLPMMRSHGTDTKREPWNFEETGSKYYDTIVKYIRLRYRLVPYLYSLAYQVYRSDAMMMRSLIFDYHEDEQAVEQETEYLFGDFLVCPVTAPMEYAPGNRRLPENYSWEVYLPGPDGWFDYETKEFWEGAQLLTVQAPIEKMPLYIRSGSLIPVAEEGNSDLYHPRNVQEITVEIYGGRDGAFAYYQDAGNGYGYQKGEYQLIEISWQDDIKCVKLSDALAGFDYPKRWNMIYFDVQGRSSRRQMVYAGKGMKFFFPDRTA